MLSTSFIYVVRFVCVKKLRSIAFVAIEESINLYIVICVHNLYFFKYSTYSIYSFFI